MAYLIEMLGRGLLSHLWGAFPGTLDVCEQATVEDLAEAARGASGQPAAVVAYGAALLRDGQSTQARDLFAKSLATHPNDASINLGLACALDDLGRLDDAIECLKTAQRGDPSSPAILFCLGYCYERLGRVDEAVASYRDALTLCPGLRNAHERLAAIAVQRRQLDEAIAHYKQLCDWEPQLTDLQLTLANLYLQHGDYVLAIDRYQLALSMEPDNWTANDELVTAYEKAGQFREAIEHMHGVIQREPGFADSYLRLGDLYAQSGNDQAAMENYLRAVEIHPDYLEATVKIGTQHLRAGRYEDAARWFTLGLEINDRLLVAYVGLAVAQEAAGRSAESRDTLVTAASIEPNSALLFSEMARMHLKAATGRQARKYLAFEGETPSIDDDITIPQKLIDDIMADESLDWQSDQNEPPSERQRQENPGAAEEPSLDELLANQIERHRNALARHPNQADLHYRLGLLLRHAGDLDGSITCFEEAVSTNPCYVKALIKLGLGLLERGGEEDRAIATLRRAVALEPQYVDLHYHLGMAFARRQQFEIAVEHFQQAVAGNPRSAEFHANLALALQHLGLIDRASACWESVRALVPDARYAELARKFASEDRFKEGGALPEGWLDDSSPLHTKQPRKRPGQ